MAIKFLSSLDLGSNAVSGLVVESGNTLPTGTVATGRLYQKGADMFYYNGSAFEQLNGQSFQLSAATSSALGGIKIGATNLQSKSYAVQLDASNAAFVSVPWTDSSTGTLAIEVDGTSVVSDIIGGTLDFKGGTAIDVAHSGTGDLTFNLDLTELSTGSTAASTDLLSGVFASGQKSVQGNVAISTITLDKFGAPAADLAMNSKKITGLANGATASQDAATVAQMESAISNAVTNGMEFKGGLNPSSGSLPQAGVVGDTYAMITAKGNFGGIFSIDLEPGDLIICQTAYAKGASPTEANWVEVQTNLDLVDASASVKGIASFSDSNFTVSSGDVVMTDKLSANSTTAGSATKTVAVTANKQGIITALGDQDIAIPATQVTDFATEGTKLITNREWVGQATAGTGTNVHDFAHGLKSESVVAQLWEKSTKTMVMAEIRVKDTNTCQVVYAENVTEYNLYELRVTLID